MERQQFTIELSDIQPIINKHIGNELFVAALSSWKNLDIIYGLAQYVQFNSVFGPSVSNLAGEIAVRQDLFRDPNYKSTVISDKSMDVATEIFYSAIEEFGRQKSHRVMAKELLTAVAKFYGCAVTSITATQEMIAAMEAVKNGYGVNQSLSDSTLLRAIGFHMGSELLADWEFNILDRHLKNSYPLLVQYLKKEKVYTWIQVHTTVEADHFASALVSANRALMYYDGCFSKPQVKNLILEGFTIFADMQTGFMRSLILQRVDCLAA